MPRNIIDAATHAGDLLASVLGHSEIAHNIGPHMTCTEVDNVAAALLLLKQRDAARSLLLGHGVEDEDGDYHEDLEDRVDEYLDSLTESEDDDY